MMGKPDSCIQIPTSLEGKFFEFWLQFLRPYHNLTDGELKVAASFIKNRYELSKIISDEVILDKLSMGEDARKKVAEENNISMSSLQVFLTKLKKKNVMTDGKINSRFIPHIKEEKGNFTMLLFFDFSK